MPDRLSPVRGAVGHALLVVLGFAVAGVVAGWVWEALWDAPAGIAYEDTWVPDLYRPDVHFAASALYVLVALPTGLLLGLAAALVRGREGLTLAAVLVGSVLAAGLMYAVGHTLGPPDPHVLAAGEPDLTPVSGELDLAVPGEDEDERRPTALLALPAGALLGLALLYLSGFRADSRG